MTKKNLQCIIQIGMTGLTRLLKGETLEILTGEPEPVKVFLDLKEDNIWNSSHKEA